MSKIIDSVGKAIDTAGEIVDKTQTALSFLADNAGKIIYTVVGGAVLAIIWWTTTENWSVASTMDDVDRIAQTAINIRTLGAAKKLGAANQMGAIKF